MTNLSHESLLTLLVSCMFEDDLCDLCDLTPLSSTPLFVASGASSSLAVVKVVPRTQMALATKSDISRQETALTE